VVLSCHGYGGKLLVDVSPAGEAPAVVGVQVGAFAPAACGAGGSVELRSSKAAPSRMRVLGLERGHPLNQAVSEAEVVVAAGRGVGGPQGLAAIERLAALFPSAAVAGSRPVCDAGWLALSRQVGMTGATVEPRLYLACGISGSRQHTVGFRGAELVVAINSDPQAAIFGEADLAVVEDLSSFLPLLIDACESE